MSICSRYRPIKSIPRFRRPPPALWPRFWLRKARRWRSTPSLVVFRTEQPPRPPRQLLHRRPPRQPLHPRPLRQLLHPRPLRQLLHPRPLRLRRPRPPRRQLPRLHRQHLLQRPNPLLLPLRLPPLLRHPPTRLLLWTPISTLVDRRRPLPTRPPVPSRRWSARWRAKTIST